MTGSIQTRISALALLAANALPLCGVLFWGWPLGKLMALYWAETAVIGVLNIFRMLMISPVAGLPLAVFFTIHFGGFMLGHGLFLSVMFLDDGGGFGPAALLAMARSVRARRGARIQGAIQRDPCFLFIFASLGVIWSKPAHWGLMCWADVVVIATNRRFRSSGTAVLASIRLKLGIPPEI